MRAWLRTGGLTRKGFAPLERLLFAGFLAAWLLVAPERDYYTDEFFVGIAALMMLPQAVLSLGTIFIVVWSLRRALAHRKERNANAAIKDILWATGALAVTAITIMVINDRAGWGGSISRSVFYGSLSIGLALLLVAAPIALLLFVVPTWAVGRAIVFLAKRRTRAALLYASVPLLGVAGYFGGQSTADFITVRTIGPVIQSAIQSVRNGQRLPPRSQAYPIAVSAPRPYIATYSLGGPLFLASYIAYDENDSALRTASHRIGQFLDNGICALNTRSIAPHYYVVTELC